MAELEAAFAWGPRFVVGGDRFLQDPGRHIRIHAVAATPKLSRLQWLLQQPRRLLCRAPLCKRPREPELREVLFLAFPTCRLVDIETLRVGLQGCI